MHDMATTMHMSFFWGDDVVLLFAGWPGSGHLGMYLLALAVVFLLAAVAELLSSAPTPDRRWQAQPAAALGDAAGNAASHAVHMVLAYFVMLSVMSYNIGVFLAAVAGGATGRFVVVYRELIAAARPPEEVEY